MSSVIKRERKNLQKPDDIVAGL